MNNRGIICYLLALTLIALPVLAQERDSSEHVRTVILDLCKLAPNHPTNRNAEYLDNLVDAIIFASNETGEDPILLTGLFYYESSFLADTVGKLGELGLGQVMPGAATKDCDLNTMRGEAMCAARWLASRRTLCDGSDYQALTAYAGLPCVKKTRMIDFRMRKIEEMRLK
jgi:hypothetical protein